MALHLRMLRHAIERSPTELQRILDEVLRLPKRKQKELAVLLDETDLSAIISAATMVADRLKFLQGLQDYPVRSRGQEPPEGAQPASQDFGNQHLDLRRGVQPWASDKELTTVLKIHKENSIQT